jgi:hypothetical protein
MFDGISFNKDPCQQVKGEIMYPARGNCHGVVEQFHYALQAPEFFDILKTKSFEYQPGIYYGKYGNDDSEYELIGMKPEWQKYQYDPACHCQCTAEAEDFVGAHIRMAL